MLFSIKEHYMGTSRIDKKTYWLNHINQWRESGLTQAEYCRKENINYQSFSWWKIKGHKGKSKKEVMSFVPAVIKTTDIKNHQLQNEIHLFLPNQTKLVLPDTLPLNNLVYLIKSLGGLS
jgi:hypothetical protein